MLSFFSNIKNIIREKLKHKHLSKRAKRYQVVVMGSDIITNDDDDNDNENENENDNDNKPPTHSNISSPNESPQPSPPPPSPMKIHTFFNTDIEDTILKNDYELQTLITTMKRRDIDLTKIVLEPRFEELLQSIPEMPDVIKIKLRILYIIIALDMYWNLFEEKKKYRTSKTKHTLGVFRYNDYIIRIDDSPYSFMNENDVIHALSTKSPEWSASSASVNNIILPFIVYTNVKRDAKNRVCDCNTPICECRYLDGADNHPKMNELTYEGRYYYNALRENSISFSIQRYVKNTEQLYNWIKDNMGSYIYNQFSNIQYPFFIDLFLKCAILLRDLHAADVVHGDIKPDNILVCEGNDFNLNHSKNCKNFSVYLIDFGLSGIKNAGYGTGGTIPYCHPEFKNIHDTNRSSKYNWKKQQLKHDIWSLGIIFITLYIYRDFYNYYHKYPGYFFTKDGYVSSLILDVISNNKLHELFSKMLSHEGVSIDEVCESLTSMQQV
jgi:hypothetical protein